VFDTIKGLQFFPEGVINPYYNEKYVTPFTAGHPQHVNTRGIEILQREDTMYKTLYNKTNLENGVNKIPNYDLFTSVRIEQLTEGIMSYGNNIINEPYRLKLPLQNEERKVKSLTFNNVFSDKIYVELSLKKRYQTEFTIKDILSYKRNIIIVLSNEGDLYYYNENQHDNEDNEDNEDEDYPYQHLALPPGQFPHPGIGFIGNYDIFPQIPQTFPLQPQFLPQFLPPLLPTFPLTEDNTQILHPLGPPTWLHENYDVNSNDEEDNSDEEDGNSNDEEDDNSDEEDKPKVVKWNKILNDVLDGKPNIIKMIKLSERNNEDSIDDYRIVAFSSKWLYFIKIDGQYSNLSLDRYYHDGDIIDITEKRRYDDETDSYRDNFYMIDLCGNILHTEYHERGNLKVNYVKLFNNKQGSKNINFLSSNREDMIKLVDSYKTLKSTIYLDDNGKLYIKGISSFHTIKDKHDIIPSNIGLFSVNRMIINNDDHNIKLLLNNTVKVTYTRYKREKENNNIIYCKQYCTANRRIFRLKNENHRHIIYEFSF